MGGVVIPDPRGGHVWVYGVDSAGNPVKVLVDADGHLQVDTLTSALPTGAATEAKQDTMITALQLIDDLRNALTSVGTDELDVNVETTANPPNLDLAISALRDALTTAAPTGNDLADIYSKLTEILTELQAKLETADLNLDAAGDLQVDVLAMPTTTVIPGSGEKLFGFSGIVEEDLYTLNLAAGVNTLSGTSVPSGEIWVVTQVSLLYVGTPPTKMESSALGLAGGLCVLCVTSIEGNRWYTDTVHVILQAGDYMGARVEGATAGDDFYFRYAGYKLAAP